MSVPPANTKSGTSRSSLFRALGLYVELTRRWRGRLVLAFLLQLLGLVAYLGFALAVGQLVDQSLESLSDLDLSAAGGFDLNWGVDHWGLVLIVLVGINAICSYFDYLGFQVAGERAAALLRTRLFDRLIALPYSDFIEAKSGELSSRVLADVALLQEGWIGDIRQGLNHAVTALAAIAMLFVVSPSLASVVTLVSLPVIGLATWFGRGIARNSRSLQDHLGETSVLVEENLRGIQSVKAFAAEELARQRVARSMGNYLDIAVRIARHRAGLLSGILLMLMSATVFLLWYGSHSIVEGLLTPGEFTSFMFFLGFLGNAGGMLAVLVGRVHRMAGASERVTELLERRPEFSVETSPEPASAPQPTLRGEVAFRDVWFSYPNRPDAPVLQGIDFRLEPGQCVALTGPSGAGKSSLAALLFGLFDPDSGEVLVDGRQVTEWSLPELRRQMALVPQEAFLFSGSIAENIAFGRPEAGRDEIEEAARRASAWDFIGDLPQGLDTPVGDRGITLSGGQRQRLAIARAVLCDPAVLVLDEAASALDADNERLVRQAMESLMQDRSTLVISHRLATLRQADEIHVIRDGCLVDSGTHQTLSLTCDYYRRLSEESPKLAET